MSEENEKTENNSRVDEARKRINRKQLAKTCKFFAVFAVAIMVISSFAVMVKAETPTDVNSLPYDLNNIGTTDAVFNLQCLTETTNISVRIWGMSADSILKLNSENKGTIKTDTQNIFIITATPGSTLGFTSAVGASIRIEEIKNTAISSPSNATITGKTFYKINSQCYVADVGLPQTESHQITLSPDEDITYLGITRGSISRYGTINAETIITLPKDSYIRLLSEHPVNFNLTVNTAAEELPTEPFVTGITAYSQNNLSVFDRIMLNNIEPEKYGWDNGSSMWKAADNARWGNTSSWQCSDTNKYYNPNMNESLLSPSIPLTVSSSPTLSFWTKYHLQGTSISYWGFPRLDLPFHDRYALFTDSEQKFILNVSSTQVYTYEPITFCVSSDEEILNVTWFFGDSHMGYGCSVNHSYSDNGVYMVDVIVTNNTGEITTFQATITVLNRPPVPVIDVYQIVNVTLRVAGKKNNTISMILMENDTVVGETSVTRQSGNPDEQNKTISLKVRGDKNYTVHLDYNGSNGGANPVKIIAESKEMYNETNILFNSENETYQNKTINIDDILEDVLKDNTEAIFNASESYDADGYINNFVWDFGDGTSRAGMVVNHTYAVHGAYNITLNITDDDNASSNATAIVHLSEPVLSNTGYPYMDYNWNTPIIDPDISRLRLDWGRIIDPKPIIINRDNIYIEISPDNNTWNILNIYPYTGTKNSSNLYGNADGWVKKEISLSNYMGQNVYVRFRMVSDGSVEYSAPCIDDVQIGENNWNSNGVVLTHEDTCIIDDGNVINHTVRVENNGDTNDTFILESTCGTLNRTSVTLDSGESCLVSVQVSSIPEFTGNPYDTDNDGINNAEEFYLPYYYGKIYTKDYFDSRNITRDASNLPVPLDVTDISNYTVLYGNNSQIKLKMNVLEDGIYNINIAGMAAVNDTQESRLSNPMDISLENQMGEFMIANYANMHNWRGHNDTCSITYWWNNYTFKAYLGEGTHNVTIGLNSGTYNESSPLILLLDHLYIEKYGMDSLSNDSDMDGINDMNEYLYGLSPCSADSDNDHIMDNVEIDYWQDICSIPSPESIKRANDPDFDNDRLVDGFELLYNTNITNPDSDNDGLNDYDEIFEYTKAERIEAEDVISGDSPENINITMLDDGVRLKSERNSTAKLHFNIPEKGHYRIKSVGSSVTNSSTEMIYPQEGGGEGAAIASVGETTLTEERDVVSDDVAESTTTISLSSSNTITKYNTGSMELKTKIMDNKMEISDKRYYSIYGELEKGDHTLHYMLSESDYDDFILDIDYFIIERNGLDPWDNDTDSDGLTDGDEVIDYGTSPWINDTDNDGLTDLFEVTYNTNPNEKDTDNDGILDYDEFFTYGTSPNRKDSDFDGIDDKEEIDYWVIERGLSEVQAGENATKTDADKDFMPDGYEIKNSLDPLNPDDANYDNDTVADGLTNVQEYNLGTNISEHDTDFDGLYDGDEIISILFRTNIMNGAVGINGYQNEDLTDKWIYYNSSEWANGEEYIYYLTGTNTGIGLAASPLSNRTKLVLTLKDGTGIYLNTIDMAIYVWEPNSDINDADNNSIIEGTYYYFGRAGSVTGETSNLPVAGYKNMEIFYGANPLKNDTDRDGVLDGNEYGWNNDYDNDGIINVLDRDSDNDGLTDGQEWFDDWRNNADNDTQYLPNMVDSDSDDDNLPDSLELLPLSDTDGDDLPNFIDVDSDNDTLWDGFNDTLHPNGIYDSDEFGEDVNGNGIVDVGETSPIRWDSDNDQLSDGEEISNAVFWYEAENYATGTIVNDVFASSNMSATNNTGDNQICSITSSSVPDGTYLYYIRARLAPNVTSSNLSLQVTGIFDENITISTNNYRWYVTGVFNATDSVTVFVFGSNVCVDKMMLVKYDVHLVDSFLGPRENTVAGGSDGFVGGSRIYIPHAGDLKRLELMLVDGTGAVVKFHLYTDSGGEKGTLIASTDLINVPNTPDTWCGGNFGTGSIPSSGYYWIVITLETGGTSYVNVGVADDGNSDTYTGDGQANYDYLFKLWMESYLTDPTYPDTDYDGLNDGDEMGLVETDNLPNTYTTSPINPDSDNDMLLDGEEMKGWYIMVEQGDEEHLTHVTSNPLMVDSDDDGLLDSEEIFNAVYWVSEAENYRINDTQLVDNNKAITNKTGTDEIYNVTLSVPNGTYKYYVRAKGDGTILNLTVNCSGMFTNEIFTLTDDYRWYSTSVSNVTNRTITMLASGSVFVDKVMLMKKSIYSPTTFWNGSQEVFLDLDDNASATIYLDLSAYQSPYAYTATIKIWCYIPLEIVPPSYVPPPANVTLRIGNEIVWHFTESLGNLPEEWSAPPMTKKVSECIVITHPLNRYISGHRNEMPLLVPLTFSVVESGGFSVSIENIIIKTFATNPLNSDTDYDGLWDGDEIQWYEKDEIPNLYPSSPADSDSDNDLLSDGKEVIGWNITVERVNDNITIFVTSDPRINDTDSDSIPDFIEYNNLNASNPDTDEDGLIDNLEVMLINGQYRIRTDPCDVDTDDDLMLDGATSNETLISIYNSLYGCDPPGEDWNNDGIINLYIEPNPLNPDTDNDGIIDGYEYFYVNENGIMTCYADSDSDGYINLCDPDSDNDGLCDGEENWNHDQFLNSSGGYYIEADPTNPDCDGDGLLDGAEPLWYGDPDEDNLLNVWDDNSNNDGYLDNVQVYVVFRTSSVDSNGDGNLDYCSGTWVAVDTATYGGDTAVDGILVVSDLSSYTSLDLWKYTFSCNVSSFSSPTQLVVSYDGNNVFIKTPEGYEIYISGSDTSSVYIHIGSVYAKYVNPTDPGTDEDNVYSVSGYVWQHQETYDGRPAVNLDSDFDGLSNSLENSVAGLDPDDADSDDDGIPDGQEDANHNGVVDLGETDPVNWDSDSDSLSDGTEIGLTKGVEATDAYGGTDLGAGHFKKDMDTNTVTDPTKWDTDGDGLGDGEEDKDFNGMFDDKLYTNDVTQIETDVTNPDTDKDGIIDGEEVGGLIPYDSDSDDDGISDGEELRMGLDPANPDSDNDGLSDGTEIGLTSGVSKGYGYRGTDTTMTYYFASTGITHPCFVSDANSNTRTDPDNDDSDGDDIIDGLEDKDYEGMVDSDETDPNNWDSDGDEISDYIEMVTWLTYGVDTDIDDDGLINARDLDSDGDGINDGVEDTNHNGIQDGIETKAYDADSDGDGLYDGYNITIGGVEYWGELTVGTDPLKEDTDEDQLWDGDEIAPELFEKDDIDEKGYKTNPLSDDSDMDGLSDYDEIMGYSIDLDYYSLSGHIVVSNYATVSTEPLNPDSDGDGLNDGQEVNGWTVMVAYEQNDEMKTKEYTFKTDPTTFNDDLDSDSDRDGILDKDEITMSELCDYYDNADGWKNIDSYHQDLYSKYSWFIENRVEKATSWSAWNETIQSQFNPYVKENIPPIITAFKSDFEYDSTWYGVSFTINYLFGSYTASVGLNIIEAIWVKTTVSVFDAGCVSSLTIGLSTGVSIPTLSWSGITYNELVMNIGSQTYTNIESGWNTFEFIKSVNGLTWALGQAIGFDAKVSVTDVGGETTSITLHRDGLFDKAWDFLTEIWSQFKDTVVSAAKAAWEAFNAILNWIKETVRFMFENVFKPVKNALDSLVNAGVDVFIRGWELYFAEDKPDDAARIIADWIFEVSAVFMAIWTVLFYLETLVKPFQPIVSGIVAVVGGIMLGVMLCYILPLIGLEGVPDVENVFITGDENSEDGISDSINENSPGSISKEMLCAALGMICSAYTYFLTVKYAGLFGTFVKGLTPTVMGVVFAFVSFLVSACSVVVSKTYPSLQEVCSVVSLFLAGTSLVAVVWGAAHGSMVYAPVCTILSLAFALSALLVSLYKMG